MSVRLPVRILVAALLLAPLTAGAQTPADRRAIEAFRDSLAQVADTAALARLEASMIAAARQERDNPLLKLRLGFLALRLGDLGSRRHYDLAGGEFQWASELEPKWPYPWYGLGLAELGVGDSELSMVSGLQTMLGKDALTRSANAFAKSAEVDPTFVFGLVELSNTALQQRINSRLDVALVALRRAGATPVGHHPDVRLARGRVERAAGSLDSSIAVLHQLVSHDSTALAQYEWARSRLLRGSRDAASPWFAALRSADATTLALYRTDLLPLFTDSLLRAFDAASATARGRMVEEFIGAREADELRQPGGRLVEHYRRLDHAQREFRLVTKNRQFDIAERYRSGQAEYDDRGLIYIRHGAPDDRAEFNAPGVEPNVSWLYRRDDGDLLFHFVARQDVQDYRLVESLFDALGYAATLAMRSEEALRAGHPANTLRQQTDGLLRSREFMNPMYTRLITAGRATNDKLLTDERAAGRATIRIGTTTDSWPLRFPKELRADIAVLAVGADSSGARLQVAFAIPGRQLQVREVAEGHAYPVRLRISAIATNGTPIAFVDTTRAFLTRDQITHGQLLLGRLPLSVPAGLMTVRASLEIDGAGMTTTRDTVRVPSPRGPGIGLSDLAMGTRGVMISWVTASGDTAWINPSAIFRRNEPMQLYFEVTGAPASAVYTVELEVRRARGRSVFQRLFGGGGAALSIAFESMSRGEIDRIAREISLSRLDPGNYAMQVTIITPDQRKIVRQRAFTVVE